MDDLIIRTMEIEDAEAVTDILIDSWQTSYRGIVSNEYLDNMDKGILADRRRKQYRDYIVAVSEGRIVGYCWYVNDNSFTKDISEIDSEVIALYVDPKLKRQGLGRRMLSYVIDDLKKQGRKNMIIWCLKENYPSRKFYEKMGGMIIGEHMTNIGYKDYEEVGFLYKL